MPMPWEKKKSVAGILLRRLGKPDVTVANEVQEGEGEPDPMQVVAEDLLAAVETKSVADLTKALRAFADMIADDDEAQDADLPMPA